MAVDQTGPRSTVFESPKGPKQRSGKFVLAVLRQSGAEARAAFAINYLGNPGQDGELAAPAPQVLRRQSW
jgi:hypothetical protein